MTPLDPHLFILYKVNKKTLMLVFKKCNFIIRKSPKSPIKKVRLKGSCLALVFTLPEEITLGLRFGDPCLASKCRSNESHRNELE